MIPFKKLLMVTDGQAPSSLPFSAFWKQNDGISKKKGN
jgi:hypothetical protein